ncbi:MAG: hypothetical protein IPF92_10415 [Myxococcales bacterium]|nr:hypothetical protein [Myxococcales bacterium]
MHSAPPPSCRQHVLAPVHHARRAALTTCALTALALAACGGRAAAPTLPPPEAGRPVPPAWQGAPQQPGQPGQPGPAPATGDPREADVPALLGATLTVLQKYRDEEAAAAAIVPYLHKSLLDASGARLTTDVRSFSFKKAHGSAGLYSVPVTITRVRPSAVTAIGFGPTGEQGRSIDYFVAKRPGVNGMPAPVTVFFPAGGGPPKVAYLGSL